MDRRTAYTRKVIKESLSELLENRSLDQITVKALCEKADINRATFYRNFLDIYDLFDQLEQELSQPLLADTNLKENRYQLLELMETHQSFYREYFSHRLESPYIKELMDSMYEQILRDTKTPDTELLQMTYRFNYYGVLGLMKEWVTQGCPEPATVFGQKLYTIVDRLYPN